MTVNRIAVVQCERERERERNFIHLEEIILGSSGIFRKFKTWGNSNNENSYVVRNQQRLFRLEKF